MIDKIARQELLAELFTFSLRSPQFGVFHFYSEIPTPILRLIMIPCNAKGGCPLRTATLFLYVVLIKEPLQFPLYLLQ